MDPTVIAATLTGLVIGIPIGRAFSVSALRRPQPTADPPAPVAYDDPQRDPNWCWMHNKLWPACADEH